MLSLVQVPEVPISQIVLQKDAKWKGNQLYLGYDDSYQLNCTFIPENTPQRELLYSSSHPDIVTISNDGVLHSHTYPLPANTTGYILITVKSASNPDVFTEFTVSVGLPPL